ncbi:NAD(P)-dependent oxidoreductase [Streptomyces boninensis]|uniref:NAD(P)-dependent oxidoreductase n=1 Tax=Streptomyces boninensis TaxID=2039455 RepID=UPI003B228D26
MLRPSGVSAYSTRVPPSNSDRATRPRSYDVTAVVRDPARYPGPADGRVRIAAGDVTDPATVALLAEGHDAAVNAAAVYGEGTDPAAFFPAASRALTTGLPRAGVGRLIAIGIATLLPQSQSQSQSQPDDRTHPPLLLDSPALPPEARPFSLAHAAGLEVLRAEAPDAGALDWVYLSPAGDFDHDAARTGRYAVRKHGDLAARISYPDLAVAVLDEIDHPTHHRSHLAVT